MPESIGAIVRTAAVAALIQSAVLSAGAGTASNLKCKGCVGASDIGKKAVRKKHIKPNAVTGPAIRVGSVTQTKIGANAVTGAKILDGSIGAADLAATAKPTGADSVEGPQSVGLSPGVKTLRTVTISAPAAGLVLANASGYFQMSASTSATCSISLAQAVENSYAIHAFASAATNVPFAGTRLLEVPAGETAIRLVCSGSGNPIAHNTILTAAFIPNRY